ncbi:hypothetical protein CDL12_19382 [Handroanthus impetiginosus]|uniref:Fe-S-cluster oxidoreductase n=1 Tax=Handroanthus impetiginosus TaxID=429701 RepID=A0A2G9GRU7_9LAMI|nr:hypothetical protein CDL12_19382 [Handroanthus impetiginosus]
MLRAMVVAQPPSCSAAVRAAANKKPPSQLPKKTQRRKPTKNTTHGFGGKKKEPVWQCVNNCGACCKLDKGPNFPSPDEIFEDPSDVQLYKSLIGEDGWCVHYDKSSRKCSIYAERPYFCRVEPEIFDKLYGIDKKKFNKEACSCCVDTIKAVYGTHSEELEKFNHAIWSSGSK